LEVGKALSKEEREERALESKSLIYGEVEFSAFSKVLRKIGCPPGGVFYDLGSGTGRAVFTARMTQDFSKCVGIELLEGLSRSSQQVCQKFNTSGFERF